ncbi:hypothetical protein EV421DRAFT_1731001 [Armillaria borealis]|uniref:Uncharacterized protein n=1 Tax=Armillaria borealis TaxID=47425 RepID=A0AA39K0K7_9AGAR|nr:hypothetical protein EV421DRAFT_1731001 [Armillaria borealis]
MAFEMTSERTGGFLYVRVQSYGAPTTSRSSLHDSESRTVPLSGASLTLDERSSTYNYPGRPASAKENLVTVHDAGSSTIQYSLQKNGVGVKKGARAGDTLQFLKTFLLPVSELKRCVKVVDIHGWQGAIGWKIQDFSANDYHEVRELLEKPISRFLRNIVWREPPAKKCKAIVKAILFWYKIPFRLRTRWQCLVHDLCSTRRKFRW